MMCAVSGHTGKHQGTGNGNEERTEPSDSVQKLKECVLQYVKELKERKKA